MMMMMNNMATCESLMLKSTNLTYSEIVYITDSQIQRRMYVLGLLLLPLALQPVVGFGLSNNVPPFCPICHHLSPSSHSQHLKISLYFFSPSFPGSSSSSRPFHFLSEDLFGHPILLHSLQVTQPTYPLLLYPFYYIFSFSIRSTCR